MLSSIIESAEEITQEMFLKIEADPLIKKIRYEKFGGVLTIANAAPGLTSVKENHQMYAKGIVYFIHPSGDFELVAMPFKKFFNSFEGIAVQDMALVSEMSQIKTRIVKKYDGTLIIRFEFRQEVMWATRGRIISEDRNDFWDLLQKALPANSELWNSAYDEPDNRTLLFELVSPENYIGERYSKTELVLIGVTHIFSADRFAYQPSLDYRDSGIDTTVVKIIDVTSPEEAFRLIPNDAIEEGVIVEYIQYEAFIRLRIKYKTEAYLSFIRAINNMSEKRIFEMAVENKLYSFADIESFFAANFVNASYEELVKYVSDVWPLIQCRIDSLQQDTEKVLQIAEKYKNWEGSRKDLWQGIVAESDGSTFLAGITINAVSGKTQNIAELLYKGMSKNA